MLAMAVQKTDEPPLLQGLRWILANRKQPSGKAWSMRALAIAAGLAPSHVEGLLNGRQQANVGLKTAQALAKAGNVRTSWLQSGQGPREPYEVDDAAPPVALASPAPPPVSETRVTSDKIDELLDLTFDPREHHPSDVRLVVDALESHATLLRGSTEPTDIVRALLDTVAEARAKGRKLTAEELPAAALGSTKRRLTFAEAKISQLMAQAVAEAERLELEPRDTPHPDLVAAQRRAGLGEAGTSGPRRGG